MVSIHIVPVIVCLIIKVISSTFRFKRGTIVVRPTHRGSRIARKSRNEQRQSPRRYEYTPFPQLHHARAYLIYIYKA